MEASQCSQKDYEELYLRTRFWERAARNLLCVFVQSHGTRAAHEAMQRVYAHAASGYVSPEMLRTEPTVRGFEHELQRLCSLMVQQSAGNGFVAVLSAPEVAPEVEP